MTEKTDDIAARRVFAHKQGLDIRLKGKRNDQLDRDSKWGTCSELEVRASEAVLKKPEQRTTMGCLGRAK